MSRARRLDTLEYVLLVAVFGTALTARAGYVAVCAGHGTNAGPFLVQAPFYADANPLVDNLSKTGEYALPATENSPRTSVAHPAPLYPALRASILRLTTSMADADRWLRWLQCGLGSVAASLLFLFARRAFQSNVVATFAGFAAAFHPFWVFSSAEIEDGVLAVFLLSACLWLAARASQVPGALTSWAFGLCLAGLALTRAPLFPVTVLTLLWFLQRCSLAERGWLLAMLAFLGFASALGPWMVRNYLIFHEVFPVVDNTIEHVWLGNRSTGPIEGTPPERPDSLAANDADKLHEIWDGLRRRPAVFFERRLWAGLNFCFGEAWFQQGRLCITNENEEIATSVPDWLTRSCPAILVGVLLVLLSFSLIGWRVSYPWRNEAMPLSLLLFWIPLPYLLSHAERLSGPRLPFDAVLICYAAYGLVWTAAAVAVFLVRRGFGVEVER